MIYPKPVCLTEAYEQEKHAVACCAMLALEAEYPEAYALTPQKMKDAGAEHVTTSMGGVGWDVHFTGSVVEPLVSYSLRQSFIKTPLFGMGHQFFTRRVFLPRSATNSEGPGPQANGHMEPMKRVGPIRAHSAHWPHWSAWG